MISMKIINSNIFINLIPRYIHCITQASGQHIMNKLIIILIVQTFMIVRNSLIKHTPYMVSICQREICAWILRIQSYTLLVVFRRVLEVLELSVAMSEVWENRLNHVANSVITQLQSVKESLLSLPIHLLFEIYYPNLIKNQRIVGVYLFSLLEG